MTLARAVAIATGTLATTDRMAAGVLVPVAEAVRPEPRALPDAQTQELSAPLGRRRQLIDRLTAENNRLSAGPASPHGRLRLSPNARCFDR